MSDKNPVGRPTEYDPSKNEMVTKFCMLGATDQELADFLEVSVATIYVWKVNHKDFLEAIKAGKEEADARDTSRKSASS